MQRNFLEVLCVRERSLLLYAARSSPKLPSLTSDPFNCSQEFVASSSICMVVILNIYFATHPLTDMCFTLSLKGPKRPAHTHIL